MSNIDERVQEKVSQFHVGDMINTLIDDAEIEGRIVSISGQHAKISTPWGELTAWLAISDLVAEQPDFIDAIAPFEDDDDFHDEYPYPWYLEDNTDEWDD